MKSLIAFLRVALQEMGSWCRTSTDRDFKTVTERVEHEGLSFLTITLPAFGKDFLGSLDEGCVAHDRFPGFARSGGLPRFLGGFLELVFDRTSGRLLDEPNVDAIRSVHQITSMFGKIRLDASDRRLRAAYRGFVECEQDLTESDQRFSGLSSEFRRVGRLLWAPVLTRVDLNVYEGEIVPKHGPGSTADGLRGNAKYRQIEWTERLEEIFSSSEMLIPSFRHYQVLDRVKLLEPGAERPSKVISVPKTLKAPRLIALEPTCMQYMQQGILERLVEAIAADKTAHWLISWESQTPNQRLAQKGSIDGSLATLDLSEASDRVSNLHVRALLADHPWLAKGVDACRTRKADVPGYGVVTLSKFASMGSALCFPFESMVFATIIFVGIQNALRRQLTMQDIKSLQGRVRVYGDDIIVPVEYVRSVVSTLESFGMKVNAGKSFWTGKFRESCGGDYYDGHEITPVRVRRVFPTRLRHAEEVQSIVALRNHMFHRGFSETVDWLDERIMRVLPVFPFVGPDSPGLGRESYDKIDVDRFSSTLHKPLVKACVVKAKPRASKLDGVDALTKWFLKRGDLPFEDKDHLLRAGRPVSVDIKTRYVSPV